LNRLVAVGFALVAAGIAAVLVGAQSGGGASSGGFILIGPVPIAFGAGPNGGALAAASALMGVAAVLAILLLGLRAALTRKGTEEIDK
jgi:uncharacterized membrane protein